MCRNSFFTLIPSPVAFLLSLSLSLSLSVFSFSARADQCQLLSYDQAVRAVKILRSHQEILSYCAPCGDVKPVSHSFSEVHLRSSADGFEIELPDSGYPLSSLDLAYVYVPLKGQKDHFINLAKLAKCPAILVPEIISRDGLPIGP